MNPTLEAQWEAFNRVWRSRFARNVAFVATGTAGAQAITLAFSPLITRIYGPEAFGLLGTFMAIVAVAVPVAALAYPIAIVLQRNDQDALGLARLSAWISLTVAASVAMVLMLFGPRLATVLGVESVGSFLLLVPFAMLFAAWMQIAQQWLIRKKEYGVVVRSAIGHALIVNGAKAGIGLVHPVGAVLIVLGTLGHALYAALLFIGAYRRCHNRMGKVLSEKAVSASLKDLASRHLDFPLYRAPQNLLNAASQSLPVLMLATFFGPATAGFYTLSKMVMGAPSVLVGKAVMDVFYPRITEAMYKGENVSRHIGRATGALLAIGIIPFGLVVIFGPDIFGFIFGVHWVAAGEYARWLSLFFLFNFINKPCVAAVPVLGLQGGLLVYEIFSTTGKSIALLVGYYWFHSDLWSVALFSIIGVFAYSLMMLWIVSRAIRANTNEKTS